MPKHRTTAVTNSTVHKCLKVSLDRIERLPQPLFLNLLKRVLSDRVGYHCAGGEHNCIQRRSEEDAKRLVISTSTTQ